MTVGSPSVGNHNSKCINESTRERDLTCVPSVGRASTTDQILINTKQLIPETNLQFLICIYINEINSEFLEEKNLMSQI